MNITSVRQLLSYRSAEANAAAWSFPKLEMQIHRKHMYEAYNETERMGQSILGKGVEQFESKFANWLGNGTKAEQVLGVASGTDAIELALYCCGIEKGDMVALPSHTAYATVAAVLRAGGCPLFVDIAPNTPTLSVQSLEELLSKFKPRRIKAVIAVHLYGECCDLENIQSICHKYGLPLIEDCAQACGSTYQDQNVGTLGDYACFSFYPTKNLAACGDGGALVIRSNQSIQNLRRVRFYGWDEERKAVQWGVNSRLDSLQALLLTKKLGYLPKRIKARRRIADQYCEYLQGLLNKGKILEIPGDGENWKHSYNLYVIRVHASVRDKLLSESIAAKIPLGIHYKFPCHVQPYLSLEKLNQTLPNTVEYCSSIISLPMHPYLSNSQIKQVTDFLMHHL